VVREHFGWSYDDDLSSANKMSILFSNPSPYGIEKWSAKTRETNKNNLQRILQESERVIIVGASITDEELSTVNLENCAIIAADGSVGAIANHHNLACVVTDFDGNPHLDAVAKCGVLFVAHAHGDNQQRWENTLNKWNGELWRVYRRRSCCMSSDWSGSRITKYYSSWIFHWANWQMVWSY